MKHHATFAIASLLSILLTTLHLAHDIAVGIERGGFEMLPVVPVLVVWLYASTVLVGRRSGYLVVLVSSLLASGVLAIHMASKTGMIGPRVAASGSALLFAWTLLALGVTSIFSVVLSACGLWRMGRGQPPA